MPASEALSTRTVVRVFLTVALLAVGLYLLYLIRGVLLLVFIAVFLAVALGPAVDVFVRRGVPRAAAILAVYVLILAAIVGIGLLIVPPIVSQVEDLSADVPSYVDDLRASESFRRYDDRYDITEKIEEQAGNLPTRLGDAAGTLQSVTVGVFNTAVQLVTVLTMAFFLLLDGQRITGFVLRLLGPREPRFRLVFGEVYRSVSGYVAGNLIISLVAGTMTFVVLTVLGVPFAAPLAVLMAFLDLIPLVGATLGGLAIGAVTLFHDFPTATIVWAVVFILYQQIENNVLQPLVYNRTVSVHPLLVIVSILIGASLLGVLGALVAIPVAATIQIVVRDVWRRRDLDHPALTHGDPLDPRPAPAPEPVEPG